MGIQHEGAHARVFRGVNGNAYTKVHALRKRDVDYNDNLHRFIHRPEHNTNHGTVKMNVPAGFGQKAQVDEHNTNHGNVKLNVPEGFSQKSQVDEHNTNHGNIKLNVPEGFADKQQADNDVETVYSVVYHTMSQTFDGTPAGFVTETAAAATPTDKVAQSPAQTTAASSTQNDDEAAYESRKAAAQGTSQTSSSASATPTVARDPAAQHAAHTASPSTTASSTEASQTGVAIGNAGLESDPSVVAGAPVAVTQSAIPTHHQGLSSGAKGGIAVGVILGLGLLAGLIFFCMRRKKNKAASQEAPINEKETYNEKTGAGFTAQLNNRASSDSDKRSSTQTSATAPRLSLRPVTQFLPNLGSNRQSSGNALGSLANTPMVEKPNSAWERRSPNSTQNPFNDAAVLSEKQANPFDEGDGSAHDRANSLHSQSSSVSGSDVASPGKVGTAAAVPVQRDVHRVQLDFKPSMEDELELISGQLVRMLHEYDDGWALCIRMDRTQQGVVPRTCLSKLPVKPRGPPTHSSHSSRSGPAPPQGAMAPRPLTPTRDQSSAPQKMARKPVPGMAM